MKLSSLSIVLPAHNEAANIGLAVDEAVRVGREVAADFEVLVVNDGSHDATAEIVQAKQARHSEVELINHEVNLGYGQAVWSGMSRATKDWVFFTDSDNQFYLDELLDFVHDPLIGSSSVVIGWRRNRQDNWRRRLSGRLWTKFAGRRLGFSSRDIDCAFKLIKRDCLTDLAIKSGGATFSAELLWRLHRRGHTWLERPVTHRPRTVGASSGGDWAVITRAFRELKILANEI